MGRARIGNHLKMTLAFGLRTESRAFYRDILACRALPSPRPELDLWEFEGRLRPWPILRPSRRGALRGPARTCHVARDL